MQNTALDKKSNAARRDRSLLATVSGRIYSFAINSGQPHFKVLRNRNKVSKLGVFTPPSNF